jgi:secondary thiamine-phosphate synthase enzyme
MSHWQQITFTLPTMPRGYHLITSQVLARAPELRRYRVGLAHLFLQHTSASLTLNENASPDVRADFESSLNRLVPEHAPYQHADEGPDDMPAHLKSSLLGASLTLPIGNGRLLLGTWQGIYLCEHRTHATPRTLTLTLHGELGE